MSNCRLRYSPVFRSRIQAGQLRVYLRLGRYRRCVPARRACRQRWEDFLRCLESARNSWSNSPFVAEVPVVAGELAGPDHKAGRLPECRKETVAIALPG